MNAADPLDDAVIRAAVSAWAALTDAEGQPAMERAAVTIRAAIDGARDGPSKIRLMAGDDHDKLEQVAVAGEQALAFMDAVVVALGDPDEEVLMDERVELTPRAGLLCLGWLSLSARALLAENDYEAAGACYAMEHRMIEIAREAGVDYAAAFGIGTSGA